MTAIETSKEEPKVRMSFYVTKRNSTRLRSIPRGQKSKLVNQALSEVLSTIEKKNKMSSFLSKIEKLTPVKSEKTSEELVRELRQQAIS